MSFDPSGLQDMLGGFQARLEKLKDEAALLEATGSAGGGVVEVIATGANQILAVNISDAAFEEKELLEDLIRAATNEALRRAQEASASKLSELAGGLGLPPGMIPGT